MRWRCKRCGRDKFTIPMPHNCCGVFLKHYGRQKWKKKYGGSIFELVTESKTVETGEDDEKHIRTKNAPQKREGTMSDLLSVAKDFAAAEEQHGSIYPRPGMVGELCGKLERLQSEVERLRAVLFAAKDVREALAAAMRAMASEDEIANGWLAELELLGIPPGFGQRLDKAIKAIETAER